MSGNLSTKSSFKFLPGKSDQLENSSDQRVSMEADISQDNGAGRFSA
jgi:hypothetical protein